MEIDVAGQRVIFGSSENMDAVADGSVDFFMTSPPYWGLRDYGVDGRAGQ
jgi:DNA modification methylase